TDDWMLYQSIAETSGGFVDYTVGLHPCSVDTEWESQLQAMEAYFLSSSAIKPVALGETGLDRFHLPKDAGEAERILDLQKASFSQSLQLAKQWGVPVVVHSRGAFQECVDLIDASGVPWNQVIFHCFVEGPAEMEQLLRRGGWGSFTGVATYKSADTVRQALRAQGLGRLMLETDAPYLTPVPHRGKPNEPAYLVHTAEAAAQTLGVTLAEVIETTTDTAKTVFQIP
ncbi:MAG TPA: TatD family hydrolase, partial [Opitutaceae bacterium]|nr:TatD family hydrolase [Opitutaceae bacterium]